MKRLIPILCVLFCLVFAVPASAQLSFGDKDSPIQIKAEKATYKGNLTILEGNVDVRQGDATIRSDHMKIFRAKAGESQSALSLGAITKIVATGNFKYITPENNVSGNQGTYTRSNEQILVTGDVFVVQPNGSKLRGDKMVYDLVNERVRFGETCVGDNCNSGRVKIRIEK